MNNYQTNHLNNQTNQAVLITGASGGIASAFLKQALQNTSYHFVLVSRDLTKLQERLEPVFQELNALGFASSDIEKRLSFFERDLNDLKIAENLCQDVLQELNQSNNLENDFKKDFKIVHLVNTIGSTLIQALHRTTIEQFQQVIHTNLSVASFVLKSFLNHVLSYKTAEFSSQHPEFNTSAVFFSSVVSQIGVHNHEAITVAKAGVEGLIKSAAASYASHKIRINGIAPGLTETPLVEKLTQNELSRQAIAKQYPLVGISQAADVAQGILYLLNQTRATGQVLAIDGGFSVIRPTVK